MTDALIRDFRGYVKGGGRWPDSLLSFATRLADALEERGAQLERESKALTLAVEDVRQFRDRARAAEAERDRMREALGPLLHWIRHAEQATQSVMYKRWADTLDAALARPTATQGE